MVSWILPTISKIRDLFRRKESNREFKDEVEMYVELLTARFAAQMAEAMADGFTVYLRCRCREFPRQSGKGPRSGFLPQAADNRYPMTINAATMRA
jgi:hypothetical protein